MAKIIPFKPKQKPASLRKKKPAKPPNSIYQLKITLQGISPAIWRRILVSADTNLGCLHGILQIAMGWTNSHLHQFISGDTNYMDPELMTDAIDFGPQPKNEFQVKLSNIFLAENDTLIYEYDFGDSWEHVLLLEKILTSHEAFKAPAVCIEGERACPPEDCGGVHGYANLCEIIMEPGHDEFEDMMTWLPDDFEPEAFDIDKVNRYLKKLKWKRPTWQHVSRILCERDGVDFE